MGAVYTELEWFRAHTSFNGVGSRTKSLMRSKITTVTRFWVDMKQFMLYRSVKVTQHSSICCQNLWGTWIIWHLSCKSLNSSLYHEDSWLALSAVYLLCSPQLSAVLFFWHWEKNNWNNIKSYDKCVFVCVCMYIFMHICFAKIVF